MAGLCVHLKDMAEGVTLSCLSILAFVAKIPLLLGHSLQLTLCAVPGVTIAHSLGLFPDLDCWGEHWVTFQHIDLICSLKVALGSRPEKEDIGVGLGSFARRY